MVKNRLKKFKFTVEEKELILKKKYLSIPEMLVRYDFLTIGLLNSLLFNRHKNGLSKFVGKFGASYAIKAKLFEEWIEARYKADDMDKMLDKKTSSLNFMYEGDEMITPDE